MSFNGPCAQVPASTFGLGGNDRKAEFGEPRVYEEPGHTYKRVWKEGTLLGPGEKVEKHPGIDYASHDEDDAVANLPFTAGYVGKAWAIKGSKWNTINLLLDNGVLLQFLHASKVDAAIPFDERRPLTVRPDTPLGVTGATNAAAIHLHVQAKLPDGSLINPDCAPLIPYAPAAPTRRRKRKKAWKEKGPVQKGVELVAMAGSLGALVYTGVALYKTSRQSTPTFNFTTPGPLSSTAYYLHWDCAGSTQCAADMGGTSGIRAGLGTLSYDQCEADLSSWATHNFMQRRVGNSGLGAWCATS